MKTKMPIEAQEVQALMKVRQDIERTKDKLDNLRAAEDEANQRLLTLLHAGARVEVPYRLGIIMATKPGRPPWKSFWRSLVKKLGKDVDREESKVHAKFPPTRFEYVTIKRA